MSGIAALNSVQRRGAWQALALSELSDDTDSEHLAMTEMEIASVTGVAVPEHSASPAASGRVGANAMAELGQQRVDRKGCPHCGGLEAGRWGQADGMPRYRCKACRRTFNALTGTPLARLRMKDKWATQAEALIDGVTTAVAAKRCGVDYKTAFRWRHRFLKSLAGDKPSALSGIVESDETFILESFKGKRSDLPRKARKRGGKSAKRGLSAEQIPVIVARDRHGATTDAVLPKLNRASIAAALGGIVTPATNSAAMAAPRSSPSPGRLESQRMFCRRPVNPTRARRIFTSTTSTRITAASRNGCAASMASQRKTWPTIWGGAEPLRRWATRPRPRDGCSELSESGHINR